MRIRTFGRALCAAIFASVLALVVLPAAATEQKIAVASIDRVGQIPNSPGPFVAYTKAIIAKEIVDPYTIRFSVSYVPRTDEYTLAFQFKQGEVSRSDVERPA